MVVPAAVDTHSRDTGQPFSAGQCMLRPKSNPRTHNLKTHFVPATRFLVFDIALWPIFLRFHYALSGTDLCYAPLRPRFFSTSPLSS
eukprot:713439-Rhodomonas_salina.2